MDSNTTPYKRRRETNEVLDRLSQLVRDQFVDGTGEKINKNDILSLTTFRLLRRKYFSSDLSNLNVSLSMDFDYLSNIDQMNGFFIVMNKLGRIIFISDNVENYLRKNVRTLYPHLSSIYECVSKNDHDSIRRVLSNETSNEQSIICTWTLLRGKRPSRAHTETKPMIMTGHYLYLHADKTKDQQEPVFIARCEQILSSTPNIPNYSSSLTNNPTVRFVLDDQLKIVEVSSSAESILGFSSDQLIDRSLKQFLPIDDWNCLDQARSSCVLGQHCTKMNVFNFYTINGDQLTFLCNTHLLMENRKKSIKFGFLAQLIDPTLRENFLLYANKQNEERMKTTLEQESMFLSNIYLNNTNSMNSSTTVNDEQIDLSSVSTLCLSTTIPQRRKRRRRFVQEESNQFIDDKSIELRSCLNESFQSNSSSNCSVESSSPIQEIDSFESFIPFFNEITSQDKVKYFSDYSTFDDLFELNFNSSQNHQSISLLTPTISTFSFFS